jgi:hypothetical protein
MEGNTGAYTGFYHYGGELFTGHVSDGVEVLYTYVKSTPVFNTLDVGYQYEDTANDANTTGVVTNGHSPFTQKIANNFPQWMDLRKDQNSVGQALIKAWAPNLESVEKSFTEYRKDQFLTRANLYDNITYGYSGLSFKGLNVYTPIFNNMLYNSSFSILGPKRYVKPDGWGVYRDNIKAVSFDEKNAIFGTRCLVLDGQYGKAEIKQSNEFTIIAGSATFSIYVKTDDTELSTAKYYEPSEAGIFFMLEYIDGSISSFGAGFPKNTKSNWARVAATGTIEKELHKYHVVIVNRVSGKFLVDLPQLENAKSPSSWTPSIIDTPVYANGGRTVAGVQAIYDNSVAEKSSGSAKKIEVLPLRTEDEFRNIKVPTRIEKFTPKEHSNPLLNLKYGRKVNYFEEVLPLMWKVNESKLVELSITTADVYSSHLPADMIKTENMDIVLDMSAINSADILVKAVTIVGNYFYVITYETYGGQGGYYLKIVEPIKKDATDTHLPSIGDIKLDLDLGSNNMGQDGLSEDVIRVGIAENIPDVIFIDTNLDRRFYFKLCYDYYYANFGTRRLFCRENYVKQKAHLQVI